MYIVQDILVGEDISEEMFVCDLEKCKGACCVEGDLGAPLTIDEKDLLVSEFPNFKYTLSSEGLEEIKKQGLSVLDSDKEYSTPIINGRECVFAVYEQDGKLACGIEKAWKEGKTSFRKPISCHLYPIREVKYPEYLALNYSEWHICSPACSLGKSLGVPLYKFLKDALIRRFGSEWYDELCAQIDWKKSQNIE